MIRIFLPSDKNILKINKELNCSMNYQMLFEFINPLTLIGICIRKINQIIKAFYIGFII